MGCGVSKDIVVGNIPNGSANNARPRRLSSSQLESRILEVGATRNITFGVCKARYAFVTQRGFYPDDIDKSNQDALSVKHQFADIADDAWFSVLDGHGRHGDRCAQFIAKKLPEVLSKMIKLEKVRTRRVTQQKSIEDVVLSKDQIHEACVKAHNHSNDSLHREMDIDDSLSGTTSISIYFHGPGSRFTVCNVGDSRAVLGQVKMTEASHYDNTGAASKMKAGILRRFSSRHKGLTAIPLSRDQTPYRRDERNRVKKCGARVLSLDQLEGYEPLPDDKYPGEDSDEYDEYSDDLNVGEEIDEYGDPPRVWSPNGEYPGTAFTRSFGDSIAEDLGVIAEPEIISRELTTQDKIIVLASDGVFEFLTNQSVIDICAKFQDPLEACRAVVAEAYELWLQYEHRTDDITIICFFLDEIMTDETEEVDLESSLNGDEIAQICRPLRQLNRKNVFQDMMSTRRILSSIQSSQELESMQLEERAEEEQQFILDAIDSNAYLRKISQEKKLEISKKIISKHYKCDEVVIKQGDDNLEYLYILDYGKLKVFKEYSKVSSLTPESNEIYDSSTEIYTYDGVRSSKKHPSFGDLALIHSKPRDATVKAMKDSHLWLLPKQVFQEIVFEQNEKRIFSWLLTDALRGGVWIKKNEIRNAKFNEIESIILDKGENLDFDEGETIIEKGDEGDAVYFIMYGGGESLLDDSRKTSYEESKLIGEDILDQEGSFKYPFKITAISETRCIKLSLKTLSESLKKEDA